MSRYFKVNLPALAVIYDQVRSILGQPHEYAQEPFPLTGDFNDGNHGYVALGPQHITGDYAVLIDGDEETPGFVTVPGVEEITREQYFAAMPEPEQ